MLSFLNFDWNMLALQCCVSFYCTAEWISFMYTCVPSFSFISHLDHYRALRRVPVLYSRFSLVICFLHKLSSLCQSQSPNSLHPIPFPFGSHIFFTCVSISALQIRSSISFFYIPHICLKYLYFHLKTWRGYKYISPQILSNKMFL